MNNSIWKTHLRNNRKCSIKKKRQFHNCQSGRGHQRYIFVTDIVMLPLSCCWPKKRSCLPVQYDRLNQFFILLVAKLYCWYITAICIPVTSFKLRWNQSAEKPPSEKRSRVNWSFSWWKVGFRKDYFIMAHLHGKNTSCYVFHNVTIFLLLLFWHSDKTLWWSEFTQTFLWTIRQLYEEKNVRRLWSKVGCPKTYDSDVQENTSVLRTPLVKVHKPSRLC